MTQTKHAPELECNGSCDTHEGEVVTVCVKGWGNFNYCKKAIEEDQSRGLDVTESADESDGGEA